MKESEEQTLCENCGNPINDCECVCPYCGEAEDCICCIGYCCATGG